MPPHPTTRLAFEELDARTMPSVCVSITLPPPVTITTVVTQAAHPLHGTASGNYTGNNALVVDVGVSDTFTGTAHLAGLGWFHLSGTVQGVGFIPQGHASGELVLANAHGSITVALHGPLQPGFSSLPSHFHYTVVGGTGAFQHLGGEGRVDVALFPAPIAFGQPPQGSFNLTFS